MLIADFLDGQMLWQQHETRKPDLRRYQGAMFLDRPDLWPTPTRRRRAAAPPAQQLTMSSLYEDSGRG